MARMMAALYDRMMRSTGFAFAEIERETMRKAWPLVRPTIRGVAVKRAAGS